MENTAMLHYHIHIHINVYTYLNRSSTNELTAFEFPLPVKDAWSNLYIFCLFQILTCVEWCCTKCGLSIYKPSLLSRRGGSRLAELLLVGTRWLVSFSTLAAADLHTSGWRDVTVCVHCADADWLSVKGNPEHSWCSDMPLSMPGERWMHFSHFIHLQIFAAIIFFCNGPPSVWFVILILRF